MNHHSSQRMTWQSTNGARSSSSNYWADWRKQQNWTLQKNKRERWQAEYDQKLAELQGEDHAPADNQHSWQEAAEERRKAGKTIQHALALKATIPLEGGEMHAVLDEQIAKARR